MKNAHFYFSGRIVSKILSSQLGNLKVDSKILDDGCGDGVMLNDLKRLGLLQKHRVYAIDISLNNIKIAKRRESGVAFRMADAQQLPFKSNFFDFIYSWMVIEHVENIEAMASEMSRVLKPNCRCYVSSVLKLPWAVYFYRKNSKFVIDPTHLHEFKSLKEFADLFKSKGFRVIKIRKEPARYSVLELFIKILLRLKIIKPSVKLRGVFTNSGALAIIRRLVVPIPGFYHIEGLFEKESELGYKAK